MPWFVLLQARILGMLPSCAGSTVCEACSECVNGVCSLLEAVRGLKTCQLAPE